LTIPKIVVRSSSRQGRILLMAASSVCDQLCPHVQDRKRYPARLDLPDIEIYRDRVASAEQHADVLARAWRVPARQKRGEARGATRFDDDPQCLPKGFLRLPDRIVGHEHDPLDKYVPAYWRDVTWKRFTDEMMPGLLHDPLELRQKYFASNLQMVRAQHRAGVPFLAGTDTAPGVYIMPGFSLHDELANFVEAGFTPMESLQTATSNPAKFLGMESSYGSVEAGKIADLVLLAANPLQDIHNTQKITAVIATGRLYDRAALDRILKQVESAAKRNGAQARANFRTTATSTSSSRTGTSVNTLERRP